MTQTRCHHTSYIRHDVVTEVFQNGMHAQCNNRSVSYQTIEDQIFIYPLKNKAKHHKAHSRTRCESSYLSKYACIYTYPPKAYVHPLWMCIEMCVNGNLRERAGESEALGRRAPGAVGETEEREKQREERERERERERESRPTGRGRQSRAMSCYQRCGWLHGTQIIAGEAQPPLNTSKMPTAR